MSIIYNTLTRLEEENPPLAHSGGHASPLIPAAESTHFFLKAIAVVITVVAVGTGLIIMQLDNRVSSLPGPVQKPVARFEQTVVEDSIEQPFVPLSAPIIEETSAQSQMVGVESEIEIVPEAVAAVSTAAGLESVVVDQQIAVQKTSSDLPLNNEPVSVVAVQPDKVDQAIEQARFALVRGQYQQAISFLTSLEAAPERRADFWLVKGSAHLGLGQLDLAETAFIAAQVLAPGNAQVTVQQAILSQEKGDHVGALQLLEGAENRHLDMPEIFLNRGYSQLALGAEVEARRSFRTFLRMTESSSLYLQQRSAVQQWLGQGPLVAY